MRSRRCSFTSDVRGSRANAGRVRGSGSFLRPRGPEREARPRCTATSRTAGRVAACLGGAGGRCRGGGCRRSDSSASAPGKASREVGGGWTGQKEGRECRTPSERAAWVCPRGAGAGQATPQSCRAVTLLAQGCAWGCRCSAPGVPRGQPALRGRGDTRAAPGVRGVCSAHPRPRQRQRWEASSSRGRWGRWGRAQLCVALSLLRILGGP